MTFRFAPAVRNRVSLIIALASASGGGKTRSALALARGLAGGDDSRVAVIDTEAGRALHYAVRPGEGQTKDRFAFQHGDLTAPFTPEAYMDAIKAADDTGKFDVIVVDSASHEWEGEGGLHDEHQEAVEAAVQRSREAAERNNWRFDEVQAADRASIGAWKEPKRRHKRLVSRLLQCRAHLILCLRADEKLRIETVEDDRGRKKTVIIQPKDLPPAERWVPICEKRFMYEMTLSLILTPQNPGFPTPIKLQEQHRAAVPLDRPLSEDTGRALADWARGGSATPHTSPAAQSAAPANPQTPAAGAGAADDSFPGDGPTLSECDIALDLAAAQGSGALATQWANTPRVHKAALKEPLDTRHKIKAAQADAAMKAEA